MQCNFFALLFLVLALATFGLCDSPLFSSQTFRHFPVRGPERLSAPYMGSDFESPRIDDFVKVESLHWSLGKEETDWSLRCTPPRRPLHNESLATAAHDQAFAKLKEGCEDAILTWNNHDLARFSHAPSGAVAFVCTPHQEKYVFDCAAKDLEAHFKSANVQSRCRDYGSTGWFIRQSNRGVSFGVVDAMEYEEIREEACWWDPRERQRPLDAPPGLMVDV